MKKSIVLIAVSIFMLSSFVSQAQFQQKKPQAKENNIVVDGFNPKTNTLELGKLTPNSTLEIEGGQKVSKFSVLIGGKKYLSKDDKFTPEMIRALNNITKPQEISIVDIYAISPSVRNTRAIKLEPIKLKVLPKQDSTK